MTLGNMFKDVAVDGEDVFAINSYSLQQAWKDIVISSGDIVFLSVCEEMEKLPGKMFRFKLTFQLWDSCITKDAPFPKVVVIIINGDRDALVGQVKLIQNTVWDCKGMEPKLWSLPMFVIYSKSNSARTIGICWGFQLPHYDLNPNHFPPRTTSADRVPMAAPPSVHDSDCGLPMSIACIIVPLPSQ